MGLQGCTGWTRGVAKVWPVRPRRGLTAYGLRVPLVNQSVSAGEPDSRAVRPASEHVRGGCVLLMGADQRPVGERS